MSVLMSVLVLAGSELAQSEWEQRFVAWLARRDQSIFGLGMVGFDLADIPWTSGWEAEKAFALRVIELALSGHRFGDLDYDPPFVKDQLASLRGLVESVNAAVVAASASNVFEDAELPVPRCEQHDVYAHGYGCILCGEDVPPSRRTDGMLPG
jgi:hypothetical protein